MTVATTSAASAPIRRTISAALPGRRSWVGGLAAVPGAFVAALVDLAALSAGVGSVITLVLPLSRARALGGEARIGRREHADPLGQATEEALAVDLHRH